MELSFLKLQMDKDLLLLVEYLESMLMVQYKNLWWRATDLYAKRHRGF